MIQIEPLKIVAEFGRGDIGYRVVEYKSREEGYGLRLEEVAPGPLGRSTTPEERTASPNGTVELKFCNPWALNCIMQALGDMTRKWIERETADPLKGGKP